MQQVERLKCELTLGGSGNESKDTIRAGKWWKEGFPRGFSFSCAWQAVSQKHTESGSAESKSEAPLPRLCGARGVLFINRLILN